MTRPAAAVARRWPPFPCLLFLFLLPARTHMAEIYPSHRDLPVVKSTDDARAGVTGHKVRYVLGFGLGGVILAFLVLGLYFGFGGH
jgi:hypothetical protein